MRGGLPGAIELGGMAQSVCGPFYTIQYGPVYQLRDTRYGVIHVSMVESPYRPLDPTQYGHIYQTITYSV